MMLSQARIVFTEQPVSRGYRFRYECEGNTAGKIPGENSTEKQKTVPAIQVQDVPPFCKSVRIVMSCVTDDEPYHAHPHHLVGKSCCNGVYTVNLTKSYNIKLQSVGIRCVTKQRIAESLATRQQLEVDPFANGFVVQTTFDLKKVRLAVQGFLNYGKNENIPIDSVVSNVIHDYKSNSDLVIKKFLPLTGAAKGDDQMMLFCEKINKDDIDVQFYEVERNDLMKWEALANFGSSDVHKQFGIALNTPPYHDQNITACKKVYIRLIRRSDGSTSAPHVFTYAPNNLDRFDVERKKRKTFHENPDVLPLSATVPDLMPQMIGGNHDNDRMYKKAIRSSSTVIRADQTCVSGGAHTPALETLMSSPCTPLSAPHTACTDIPSVVKLYDVTSVPPSSLVAQPSDSRDTNVQDLPNSLSDGTTESNMWTGDLFLDSYLEDTHLEDTVASMELMQYLPTIPDIDSDSSKWQTDSGGVRKNNNGRKLTNEQVLKSK